MSRELLEKATARPWRSCSASKGHCPCGIIWATDKETCVATTNPADISDSRSNNAPNDSRLVAAVNSYEALLGVLDAARRTDVGRHIALAHAIEKYDEVTRVR